MIEKLQSIISKYKELTDLSISPDVIGNQKESINKLKERKNRDQEVKKHTHKKLLFFDNFLAP